MKKSHSQSIPVWSDVPVYEDWLLALGREDDDEAYGAYMQAFGEESK